MSRGGPAPGLSPLARVASLTKCGLLRAPPSPAVTRHKRVRLVREEGRGVSSQYGRKGGGGGRKGTAARRQRAPRPGPGLPCWPEAKAARRRGGDRAERRLVRTPKVARLVGREALRAALVRRRALRRPPLLPLPCARVPGRAALPLGLGPGVGPVPPALPLIL